MTKDERKAIFKETIEIVRKGSYISPDGTNHIFVEDEIKKPIVNNKAIDLDIASLPDREGTIKVLNSDCLYVAEQLVKMGKTCVLNMASFRKPGGGVWNGSAAQEENLFRRTNLFRSLYQFDNIDYVTTHLNEPINGVYPLHPDFGAIYSKGVTVFRNTDNYDYALMDEPFIVDVISVSAIKHPPLSPDGRMTRASVERTRRKIHTMLGMCLKEGVENVVLGAFGCGSYGTPPSEMAKIFRRVLIDEGYASKFKCIVFAIIDDKNAHKEHNPEGNFKPFKEIIPN